MPDLLVKLYDIPVLTPFIDKLQKEGINVRRAMSYEKHQVVNWVKDEFGQGWASECDIAFSRSPVCCFIATQDNNITGFACYECTTKNFFGPMGVSESCRNQGIGKALLLTSLDAMSAIGYAYAIIGNADSLEFYKETVGAIEIPGSSQGIYRDRLK